MPKSILIKLENPSTSQSFDVVYLLIYLFIVDIIDSKLL